MDSLTKALKRTIDTNSQLVEKQSASLGMRQRMPRSHSRGDACRCGDKCVLEVRSKYLSFLEAYPNYRGSSVGDFWDEDGSEIGPGIVVIVSEEIDPHTVPEENRIPSSLDGVPVRIAVDRSS